MPRTYAILDQSGRVPSELLPVAGAPAPPAQHPDLTEHAQLGLATQADLSTLAPALHTHDLTHNHAGVYEPTHGHPYAASTHNHDAAYSGVGHTHPGGAPVHTTLANGSTAMNFGTNSSVKVTPSANATYTTTVPAAGERRTLLILTSGTQSRTITFGAGFKPVGTLATGTTTNRVFVINWISDGVNLYEAGRTAAMVA